MKKNNEKFVVGQMVKFHLTAFQETFNQDGKQQDDRALMGTITAANRTNRFIRIACPNIDPEPIAVPWNAIVKVLSNPNAFNAPFANLSQMIKLNK